MRRWIVTILLLLVTTVAFATDGSLDTAKSFSDTLTPPESDYSVAYLGQIFGTVGNVLVGTSGQLLGKMFEIFNKGVLVVAAIWLLFTVVQMAIRAAQDGSFLGQNKNGVFVALRISIGFALIIPSSSTGYSLLQNIFMKIVIQGVGLADQVWDVALNYLQYGGRLFIPPATANSDPNIIQNYVVGAKSCVTNRGTLDNTCSIPNSDPSKFPKLAPVTMLFLDEVCMYLSSSSSWLKASTVKAGSTKPTNLYTSDVSYTPSYNPKYHEKQGRINFPGGLSTAENGCGSARSVYCASDTLANPTTGCGDTGFDTITKKTDPNLDLDRNKASTSYAALKQLVDTLLPAAKNFAKSLEPSPSKSVLDRLHPSSDSDEPGSDDSISPDSKIVFNAILGYVNLITPYQGMGISWEDETTFVNTARSQGWITAGGYYRNLQKANGDAKKMAISSLAPTVSAPDVSIVAISAAPHDIQQALLQIFNVYLDGLNKLWKKYVGATQNEITSTGSGGGESIASGVSNQLKKSFHMGDIRNEGYNPIIVLMDLGNDILNAVTAMWVVAILVTTVLVGVASFCSMTNPWGFAAENAVSWLKSVMMLISSLLLLPGCILSYYVPFYPFLVYIFAAVGWIVMVIEGMAAAPLVCVGITHPEGHDFLGKGEQALMLFLGIFLRPALMVIGLLAAMLTSFVAFKMLTNQFTSLLSSLMTSTGAMNNSFLALISGVLLMVVFGFMVMELIEQCYKLIYQLPNYILKWIGGPASTGEEYGQMAAQLKGAVGSGASSFGKLMTKTPDARGMAKDAKAEYEKNKAAKKDLAVPGGGGGGGDGGAAT